MQVLWILLSVCIYFEIFMLNQVVHVFCITPIEYISFEKFIIYCKSGALFPGCSFISKISYEINLVSQVLCITSYRVHLLRNFHIKSHSTCLVHFPNTKYIYYEIFQLNQWAKYNTQDIPTQDIPDHCVMGFFANFSN